MKALLKFLMAALIITIIPAAVWAADIPLDPGYGTELNITTDYQFPKYDGFGRESFKLSKLMPTWSPDGKSLVFWAAQRLWIVSSEGGNAKLLYEKVYEVNGRSLVVASPLPIGFTPDGKEVIFSEWAFDENRGAQVTVTETGYSFTKPAQDIFAVNIETRELRLIVSDGWRASLSRDGKYLCYLYFDWRSNYDELQTENHNAIKVLNIETGESWFLTGEESPNAIIYSKPMFSADNSKIIYQLFDNNTKLSRLYQIPLTGGTPEPYNFYDGTAISENVSGGMGGLSMSSEGTWTLYVSNNYSITVQDSVPKYDDEGGYAGYYSFMHNVTRQCVYNNLTGDNYYLLPPYPYVTTQEGKFSPDGKKFCYNLRDDYNRDKFYRIFVKDFDVNKLEKISVITAVQTNGPEQLDTIKNFPNPFNPSTTIEFNLIKSENVNLSIYNLTGQKVCELASGEMTPGKHSYVWNGRDSKGTPVSSGIFFTRLETRDNVISNRMMLVK